MRTTIFIGAALLFATTALTACSHSTPQPGKQAPGNAAHHIYIVDVSDSPATENDAAVAQAVEERIGRDMKRDVRLGDVLSVFEAGGSNAARMIGHPPIETGYATRIPAAHAKLVGQLHEIAERYHAHGGDRSTHLVQSLEAIHPDCSSGHDTVTLITDGLEEDDDMSSARALAAGKPIHLPQPSGGRFLANCHKITFLGFGLTDDSAGSEQLLPARQLAALRQGWLDYLTAAGVRAQDVEFVSAF